MLLLFEKLGSICGGRGYEGKPSSQLYNGVTPWVVDSKTYWPMNPAKWPEPLTTVTLEKERPKAARSAVFSVGANAIPRRGPIPPYQPGTRLRTFSRLGPKPAKRRAPG